MAGPRFLIGFGERLTEPIPPIRRNVSAKLMPYDMDQSLERLGPMARQAAVDASSLPALACPRDEVVVAVTLHPAFIAKSYFPGEFLRDANLFQVGSRPVRIAPQSSHVVGAPHAEDIAETLEDRLQTTTQLFLAGTRSNFANWSRRLAMEGASNSVSAELIRIEEVHLPSSESKIRPAHSVGHPDVWEVVLHASANERFVLQGFANFTASVGGEAVIDRRVFAGGLCFLPVRIHPSQAEELARFSFVRAMRPMPMLRPLVPVGAIRSQAHLLDVSLPDESPVDPGLRVAVFDGGVLPDGSLDRWVTSFEPDDIGQPIDHYLGHGQGVSSAVLFGSLIPGQPAPRPYSYVDHYRVLDEESGVNDPLELFDVLRRIETILSQNTYEFLNLSIGPDLPIEDDEVHVWTAFFDDYLSDGRTFATMAVGNNGENDQLSGNARIQVPADCVNAVGVGAATSAGPLWTRASYSAIGPGRSPGVIKPDLLAFGGGGREPFFILGHDGIVEATAGTSFAAPTALRFATGVRAMFGARVSPLALNALLIHGCEPHLTETSEGTGWGRIPTDVSDIVISDDGVARILYQGELTPAKYLRAPIPLPATEVEGMVRITVTVVFATETDPQDPGNYTKSGVEITFRPRIDNFDNERALNPKSSSFFTAKAFATEDELRRDSHKWETTLHATRKFRGSSLYRPVLDLHYNARDAGHSTGRSEKIRYAMVITVNAPRVADLHERILQTYPTVLHALVPVNEIQLRTS